MSQLRKRDRGSFRTILVSMLATLLWVQPLIFNLNYNVYGQQRPLQTTILQYIKEFSIPTNDSGPLAIASGPDDAFWFTEFSAGKIGEFFAKNYSFLEFTVPERRAQPASLAIDGRNIIWFSDQAGSGSIWMLNPSNHQYVQYMTKTQYSTPLFVLIDKEDNVWFTEITSNKIGKLAYPGYTMTEYSLPTQNSGPVEMALQPNSTALWITETYANKIARFDTVSHDFREFAPNVSLRSPVGIVADKDGNVWFSEHGGSSVVKFNPQGSTFTKYPTSVPPNSSGYDISAPATLAIDKEGRLWFVEHFSNKVGRLDPASRVIDEFSIPIPGAYSVLNTLDSNGNFWFTQFSANQLGMIRSNSSSPLRITAGEPTPALVDSGQKSEAIVTITNNFSAPMDVNLSLTSSFSQTGLTSNGQVSLSSKVLHLNSFQSASVAVVITPEVNLPPGHYSVGVVATYVNASSIVIMFLQVNANNSAIALVASNSQLFIIVGLSVLGLAYLGVRLRKGRPLIGRAISIVKSILAVALVALSLIFLTIPSTPAHAKCPGIPSGGSNGPDPVGIALDIASAGIAALLVYLLVSEWLRGRRRKLRKE